MIGEALIALAKDTRMQKATTVQLNEEFLAVGTKVDQLAKRVGEKQEADSSEIGRILRHTIDGEAKMASVTNALEDIDKEVEMMKLMLMKVRTLPASQADVFNSEAV